MIVPGSELARLSEKAIPLGMGNRGITPASYGAKQKPSHIPELLL